MEPYELIRPLRKQRRLSQTELGERMGGVRHTIVAKLEKNEMQLTATYIKMLAKGLGVPASLFVDENPTIPVVGNVKNGSVEFNHQGYVISPPLDAYIPADLKAGKALIVEDDSIEPMAKAGSIIMYPSVNFVSPHSFGEISVVETPDDRVMIRRVGESSRPGYYTLQTIIGTKMEDTVLRTAAPITDIRRFVKPMDEPANERQ